ncbi:hypothetical protein EDC96DRAFT_437407 [Choanephora cucurbitarum]|nr:hypothetical protein EDC96DRAFT_437407 [Choanephora cucurbitarum]
MIEDIYTNTPAEWLQQMTRWQFFTAESLDEMTQEGLEEIFAQYAQTIEAFRPVSSAPSYQTQDDIYSDDDDDDDEGDDLWLEEDQGKEALALKKVTLYQQQNGLEEIQSDDLLFSHPNYNLSSESVDPAARTTSPLSEKPLPANPTSNDDTALKARRKSGFAGNMNRLSWTSDTGITSHIVSQNLANEIMSLFDMDFSVDIKVNTAPKLPELPFKPQRKSQNRTSSDMMSALMPAFEQIALENSPQKLEYNYQQSPRVKPNLVVNSLPKRSSSLRNRQEATARNKKVENKEVENKEVATASPPVTLPASPDTPVEKTLSKKKSLLRLITKKKLPKDIAHNSDISLSASGTHHVDAYQPQFSNNNGITNTPRKTSTSTVNSTISSSSSWSNISEVIEPQPIPQKPLPDPPLSPDIVPPSPFSYTSDESNKKHSRRARSTKKKRKSVMEKTKSKRKSTNILQTASTSPDANPVPQPKNLSRSKSAFIKIGSGLKNKKQEKQIKRTSSAKTWAENTKKFQENDSALVLSSDHLQDANAAKVSRIYSEPPEEIMPTPSTSFVKRMASFSWRMKSRNKAVEV